MQSQPMQHKFIDLHFKENFLKTLDSKELSWQGCHSKSKITTLQEQKYSQKLSLRRSSNSKFFHNLLCMINEDTTTLVLPNKTTNSN